MNLNKALAQQKAVSNIYTGNSHQNLHQQINSKSNINLPSVNSPMQRNIVGEDLFKLKFQKSKINEEINKLRQQLQIQRKRSMEWKESSQSWCKKYHESQKQIQSLKEIIQNLTRNKNESLIRNEQSIILPEKSIQKKNKFTLSKQIQPTVEIQTLDLQSLISRAVKLLSKQGGSPVDNQRIYQQAQQSLLSAINLIENIREKDSKVFQSLAFIYSNLVKVKCGQERPIAQIEQIGKKALSIYNSKQGFYYQQKIVLLNNLGLHYQKLKDLDSALKVYQQIQTIQQKYYSINDERKVLILNNIACAYYQKKMTKEGLAYFDKCKKLSKGSSLEKFVQQNMVFYKLKKSQAMNLPYKGQKFENWLSKQQKYKD